MAECTELGKIVSEMAIAIGSKTKAQNIDAVVAEMNRLGLKVKREQVTEALVLASKSRKPLSELSRRLASIRSEARTDVALREQIKELEGHLKAGTRPAAQGTKAKPPSATIKKLRQVRDGLKKEMRQIDAREREISRLEDKITALEGHLEKGTFPPKPKRAARASDEEITKLKGHITELQSKIREKRLNKEGIARARKQISELKKHLSAGTLPTKEAKVTKASPELQRLRKQRDDLKKALGQSPAAQKQKLEETIRLLNERLKNPQLPAKRPDPLMTPELERLRFERDQLRLKIQRELEALKPKTAWEYITEPYNAARAILTSFDLSGLLRQGGFITLAHPIRGASEMPDMLNAFKSRRLTKSINDAILERPNAPLYLRSKLHISPIDNPLAALADREEVYMTGLLDKLYETTAGKVVLSPVKGSERAYVTVLNKLRADTFDTMVATLAKGGEPTQKELMAIAEYINIVTGRGSVNKWKKAAANLNTVFFAPRYVLSRFQLLALKPLWGGTARTRWLIAKDYARYMIGVATLWQLSSLAGASIELDWRSSDFGKIKIGNTRIDPLSGLSQTATLIGRTITGELKSTTTGKTTALRGEGRPYGGATVYDVMGRFIRYKFSPQVGFGVNMATGEDPIGRPTTLTKEVKNLFTPISIKSIAEAIEDQGVSRGLAVGLAEVLGMGINTYGGKEKK